MLPNSLALAILVVAVQLSAPIHAADVETGSGESGESGELYITYIRMASASVSIGATSVLLNDITGISAGDTMIFDPDGNAEITTVVGISAARRMRREPGTVTFADALAHSYPNGVTVAFKVPVKDGSGGFPDPNSDAASIAKYAFAERVLAIDSCTPVSASDVCYTLHRGNGICTNACNTEACNFDDGDCKCSWTSDCPSGQSCLVGDCKPDDKWESCAETRCRTDDECDRGTSSCGAGFRCEGSTCSYNCDEWCGDSFGMGWVSDGGSAPNGYGECNGCMQLDGRSEYRTWIMIGCIVGAIVIVLVPGAIIFAVGKRWPRVCAGPWCSGGGRNGMVSPAPELPINGGKAQGTNPAAAKRRDTNPGVAETVPGTTSLNAIDTVVAPPARIVTSGVQGHAQRPEAASVARPSMAARPSIVPSQQANNRVLPPQQRQGVVRPTQQTAQMASFAQPRPGGGFQQPPVQQLDDDASSSSSVEI